MLKRTVTAIILVFVLLAALPVSYLFVKNNIAKTNDMAANAPVSTLEDDSDVHVKASNSVGNYVAEAMYEHDQEEKESMLLASGEMYTY